MKVKEDMMRKKEKEPTLFEQIGQDVKECNEFMLGYGSNEIKQIKDVLKILEEQDKIKD